MPIAANAASGSATYRVVRELGSRTLRAHAAIREPHELVVLQRFVGAEPQLLRDAHCLAKNWHPNIARVKHVDEAGGDLLLATDLIDGMTLADLFAASSGAPILPYAVIVRILVDVLAGLNALHGMRDGARALGAIHGELCPANIVVGRDGVARVINCVRIRPVRVRTESEALAYAAPEALEEGGTKDVRADVYGVGVILWEALVGLRPYDAIDHAQLLARQRSEEVMTPTIDASSPFANLGEIAMRAMAFEASLRYRTTAEMAMALRKLAGTEIAAGSAVAAKVAELAGDRIRARRAALDPSATRRPRELASGTRVVAARPGAGVTGVTPRKSARIERVAEVVTVPPRAMDRGADAKANADAKARAVSAPPRPPPLPRKATAEVGASVVRAREEERDRAEEGARDRAQAHELAIAQERARAHELALAQANELALARASEHERETVVAPMPPAPEPATVRRTRRGRVAAVVFLGGIGIVMLIASVRVMSGMGSRPGVAGPATTQAPRPAAETRPANANTTNASAATPNPDANASASDNRGGAGAPSASPVGPRGGGGAVPRAAAAPRAKSYDPLGI